jgi:hypothetical protein
LITDPQSAPPAPTLTIGSAALTVAAGGSVPLGVQVSPGDANNVVSVTVGGLASYETITDSLDQTIFSGTSVTLSAAEVNSGLTLSSSYTGSGQPVNNLALTASDSTPGGAVTSTPQTIVVTDPPITSLVPSAVSILPVNVAPALAPSSYSTFAALLDQYMAASSSQGAAGTSQTSLVSSQQTGIGIDKVLLTGSHG